MELNPKVDAYIEKNSRWQQELHELRAIVLDCGLTEELKWGAPCYTIRGGNVLLLHVFKNYCAIMLFKGALVTDPEGVLVQQSKNTQGLRHLRFTNVDEIRVQRELIRRIIVEAVAVEEAGLTVKYKSTSEYPVPEEFQAMLDGRPEVKAAFEALTPGRQRGYLLYFSDAKQSKTRAARVEKYVGQILEGKGLRD